LAKTWTSLDGRRWLFTLRDNAAFWDDSPVSAVDVENSWKRSAERAGIDLSPYSIRAENQRQLAVTVDSPRLLADPLFAVAGPVPPAGGWPQGTGPYRIEEAPGLRQAGYATGFDAVAVDLEAAAAGPGQLEFRFARGADLRDLLDEGVDLLLTGDRSVLEYAAVRSRAIPLPWYRTLALVLPVRGGSEGIASGAEESTALAGFRQRLARDAVRGEARGAEGPFWWQGHEECHFTRPNAGASRQGGWQGGPPTGRLVYASADPASRDLAERLVALTNFPTPPSDQGERVRILLQQLARQTSGGLRAAGLLPDKLAQAVRDGNESGYILSLPKRVLDPCREIQELLGRADWLAERIRQEDSMAAGELQQILLPLVDLRLRAVLGRDLSPLRIDWSGTPMLFDLKAKRR
jgi:hypothetical protein